MSTLNLVKQKLSQMTKEFHFLLQENRKLKAKIDNLQNQNDLLTRKSQDLLLTINTRLKKKDNSN